MIAEQVLVFGPLVLGVPHLLAEIDAVWRPLARPYRALVALTATVLVGLAIGGLAGVAVARPVAIAGATGCVMGALLARRHGAAWIAAVIGGLAIAFPIPALWVFAYGHNIVAIWLAATPRRLLAIAIGVAAAAIGAWLAGAAIAVAVLAVLQLAHYAAWLVWIPPRTMPMTWWAIALAGTSLLLVAALLDAPAAVRDGYLALASFHGWIELALIGAGVLRPR